MLREIMRDGRKMEMSGPAVRGFPKRPRQHWERPAPKPMVHRAVVTQRGKRTLTDAKERGSR
jgi:hypothetical protein